MKIQLSHGSGGKETQDLINSLIKKHLGNKILNKMEDSAVLKAPGKIAFTTDSFVVQPLFFPGGDIGKLALCGTVNDLAVMGAVPEHLSLSLIIEEGLDLKDLERILKSIARECQKGKFGIVCGDIKVVEKGKGDGLFINTSGIGRIKRKREMSISRVRPGHAILVNGQVGDHGASVLSRRNQLTAGASIKSDCAQLTPLIQSLLKSCCRIHAMRDATRGGLAAVANEMGSSSNVTVILQEKNIPVSRQVRGFCDLLGFSPYEMANEGKVVMAIDPRDAEKALGIMKDHALGSKAAIIGKAEKKGDFPAVMETKLGSRVILEMPGGEHLPRIC